MTSLQTILRDMKLLQTPLRQLRYRVWRHTGITSITGYWPELEALRAIVRRSPQETLVPVPDGKRVLFVTMRSWSTHAVWDSLTAYALRLRGASTRHFICGGQLPICDIAPHTLAPPMPCDNCAPFLTQLLDLLELPHQEQRDYITPEEKTAIRRIVAALSPEQFEDFTFDGLRIGQIVRPSVMWFLLSGNPPFDQEMQMVYRRFLVSGAIMARVAARLLDAVKPDSIYLLNGIFFAERIMIEQAQRRQIAFITHEGGFYPDTQIFAHNEYAPYYPLDEAWKTYGSRPLPEGERQQLDAYIHERSQGKRDVSAYYSAMESNPEVIVRDLGLDRDKLIITLYTNVDWDTACFAISSAFENMAQWIAHTIRHFAMRDDAQLIVRAHPGEVNSTFQEPRERVAQMIRRIFPTLPPHIHMIPPESSISSYALMRMSQLNLVYTSTVGLETILWGYPLVVAGRSYYSGRGFTREISSIEEYDGMLQQAGTLAPPTAEQIELARRYASLFFYRYHQPFPLTKTVRGRPMPTFKSLDALRPGRDPRLDLICDAILEGHPFLYTGDL